MAWEWSHATEAYQEARELLGQKSLAYLTECLAECTASTRDENYNWDFDGDAFNTNLAQLKADDNLSKSAGVHHLTRRENLADRIWHYAEEVRTTDNGGYNFWMCPYGCHVVTLQD